MKVGNERRENGGEDKTNWRDGDTKRQTEGGCVRENKKWHKEICCSLGDLSHLYWLAMLLCL